MGRGIGTPAPSPLQAGLFSGTSLLGDVNDKDSPTLWVPTPRRQRPWGTGAPGLALAPQLLAHLGVAASDLDNPVADGQEQFHHAIGVPALGLHQGLAQGQPHVAGQEVLVVLPRGPASQEGAPSVLQGLVLPPPTQAPEEEAVSSSAQHPWLRA